MSENNGNDTVRYQSDVERYREAWRTADVLRPNFLVAGKDRFGNPVEARVEYDAKEDYWVVVHWTKREYGSASTRVMMIEDGLFMEIVRRLTYWMSPKSDEQAKLELDADAAYNQAVESRNIEGVAL